MRAWARGLIDAVAARRRWCRRGAYMTTRVQRGTRVLVYGRARRYGYRTSSSVLQPSAACPKAACVNESPAGPAQPKASARRHCASLRPVRLGPSGQVRKQGAKLVGHAISRVRLVHHHPPPRRSNTHEPASQGELVRSGHPKRQSSTRLPLILSLFYPFL